MFRMWDCEMMWGGIKKSINNAFFSCLLDSRSLNILLPLLLDFNVFGGWRKHNADCHLLSGQTGDALEYFMVSDYRYEILGPVPVKVSANGELHDRVWGGGNQACQDVRHHNPSLHHLLGAALCSHPHQHQPRLEGCEEFSVTRGEVFSTFWKFHKGKLQYPLFTYIIGVFFKGNIPTECYYKMIKFKFKIQNTIFYLTEWREMRGNLLPVKNPITFCRCHCTYHLCTPSWTPSSFLSFTRSSERPWWGFSAASSVSQVLSTGPSILFYWCYLMLCYVMLYAVGGQILTDIIILYSVRTMVQPV